MFSDISGRVVSTFENPNVLAEYLIMFIPLAFAMIIVSQKRELKAASLICFASAALCLVFTWSRGAWLGFIFGMLVFLLTYSKKILALLFGCVALIPALPFVLPESITNRFLSIGNLADSSTSYRVHIWTGVTSMLKEHWFTGIGTGEPAFSMVYPKFALSGIELAPHSHNLFLQIMVEHGLLALILFFAVILLYVQSVFTFKRFETRKTKLIVSAMMCGILAVLLQGLTDYIWYNYRVYLIFWLLIGLTVATRRCHRVTRT
jgi:O-antigen ligase